MRAGQESTVSIHLVGTEQLGAERCFGRNIFCRSIVGINAGCPLTQLRAAGFDFCFQFTDVLKGLNCPPEARRRDALLASCHRVSGYLSGVMREVNHAFVWNLVMHTLRLNLTHASVCAEAHRFSGRRRTVSGNTGAGIASPDTSAAQKFAQCATANRGRAIKAAI